MNMKVIGLGAVLAVFVAESVYTTATVGYIGFFEAANANAATRLMLFDLVLALVAISVWMLRDARLRGITALPWLALTAFFGMAGPLGYLIRRELAGTAVSSAPGVAERRAA